MRPWSRVLLLLGLWTVPGLVSSVQTYYIQQRYEPMSLWRCLVWQVPGWWFWALVTPAILWLGRRYAFGPGQRVASGIAHGAALIAAALPHMLVSALAGRAAGHPYYIDTPLPELVEALVTKHVHLDIITYLGVLATGFALSYYHKYREGELWASKLETRLARAELQALKMQLHPHFLFNTLNAISVLVRKQDTRAATKVITGLSELLRAALDNAGRQLVPLRHEMDFVDRYLAIEQMRFRDRLRVRIEIAPEAADAEIPNLVLQPLVENAILHGIAPRHAEGTVEVEATRDDDTLRIVIRDDGAGLPADLDDRIADGMGISNVRARLVQLYPHQHRFEMSNRAEGGTVTTIELPYRKAQLDSNATEQRLRDRVRGPHGDL